MAIRVSGTLIQNTSRQSCSSQTMKIPYSGPSTLPSSCAAPMPPSTPARFRCPHRSAPSASVIGSNAPLATPWIARPASSMSKLPKWPASAVTTEPIRNMAKLTCNISLRPNRSEARPNNGMAAM